MRADQFEANAPGTLVPIFNGVAFVPAPLPPLIEPTWELTARLDKASAALARAAGYARLVANPEHLLRPLLLREAVESNRLEGTHTQIADVLRQQAVGPPADHQRAGRQLEVLRSLQAIDDGTAWVVERRELSPFLIRSLHGELLRDVRGTDKSPGRFRTTQVLIGAEGDTPAAARFVPPPPEHVEASIAELSAFMGSDETYPVLVSAALSHYQFEAIHPFEDGNGRLGRILIILMLMSRGVIEKPLVALSPFFERRRDEYQRRLNEVSTRGAWTEWVLFFLDAIQAQAEDSSRRAVTLTELTEKYRSLARAKSRTQTPLVAIDLLMERVFVSAPELATYAKCNYRTARAALEALAALGVVEQVEGAYPQLWVARELSEQVYER